VVAELLLLGIWIKNPFVTHSDGLAVRWNTIPVRYVRGGGDGWLFTLEQPQRVDVA